MNKLSIIIFSTGTCVAVPAFGGAAAGGSTEATQILNNVQLTLSYLEQVHQTAQQLEQLKTQIEIHKIHIENAKRLSQGDIMIIDQYARQLWEHWQKQQGYAHTSSELDKLFRDKYPTFGEIMDGALDGKSFPELLEGWSKEANDKLKSVLKGNAATRELIDSEETDLLKLLETESHNAPGMMKVLQVSNEIARAQINQIQGLRKLIAAQNDVTQHIAAQERVQKNAEAKRTANLLRPVRVPENKKYRRPVINWGKNRTGRQ